jgi:hypothetical protein
LRAKTYSLFRLLLFLLILIISGRDTFGLAMRLKMPEKVNDDVFIKAVSSKTSVYAGEAFSLTYILYYAHPVIDAGTDLSLDLKNCYWEDYPSLAEEGQQYIDGKLYHTKVLKKTLIIPQLAGQWEAPRVTLKFKVNKAASADSFFETEQLISLNITSKPLSMTVLALPANTVATSFSRAVGRFAIKSSYKVNDSLPNALLINLDIKGPGNLKFVNVVVPGQSGLFEVVTLPGTETHSLTETGMNSRYVAQYKLLANYRGEFDITRLEFCYFDPEVAKFVKYVMPPFKWKIKSGPLVPPDYRARSSTPFLYIKNGLKAHAADQWFFRTNTFAVIFTLTVLLFTCSQLLKLFYKLEYINNPKYRYKTARRRALKRLRKLKNIATKMDKDLFYKELVELAKEFVCDKLYRNDIYPTGNTNWVMAVDKNNDNLINQFDELFKRWDTMRFSPANTTDEERLADCAQLLKIIKALDKKSSHEIVN